MTDHNVLCLTAVLENFIHYSKSLNANILNVLIFCVLV